MPTIPDEKLYWQEEEEKRKQLKLRQQQGTEIRPMIDQLGMGNYNDRRNYVTETSNTQRAGIEASSAKQRADKANVYQQEQAQKAKWAQQESQRAYRAELKKIQDQAAAQRKEYMEYARQYGPAAANQQYGGGNNFWNGGGNTNNGSPWAASGQVAGLQGERYTNAQAIANEALRRGLGREGVIAGIMTALTESSLDNVGHGDQMGPSSRGLFQQMPKYWGPEATIMNPTGAAGLFFDKWINTSGDPWARAQAVQQSEFSDGSNYRSNYQRAVEIANQMLKPQTAYAQPTTNPSRQVSTANGLRNTVVSNAMQVIGLPYVWGGNSLTSGVDCSGLVQQIYGHLGVSLPRTAHEQSHSTIGTRAAINQLQPGDLVAWQGGWRGPAYVGHIAIYAGNGEIIEAPSAGQTVRRRNLRSDENVFGYHLSLPGD